MLNQNKNFEKKFRSFVFPFVHIYYGVAGFNNWRGEYSFIVFCMITSFIYRVLLSNYRRWLVKVVVKTLFKTSHASLVNYKKLVSTRGV